jgi:NADH dehydrogenase FAD-containing subunit/uncharacterized membrane protein YphA (DoxX/SURF4 family)
VSEAGEARVKSALGVLRTGFLASAPFVDLWARLSLGKSFFVSGMLKLGNWHLALELAQREYPVSWLNPHAAAALGAGIEVGGSILLVLGLFVRPAALAMMILALVIQFSYLELDVNLFWAALLVWYVLRGAGAFSFDRVLAKGFMTSALPLSAQALHLAGWLTRVVFPVYQFLLRLWLAAALMEFNVPTSAFPLATFTDVAAGYALPLALLLALGFATRLTSAVSCVSLIVMWSVTPLDGVTLYAPLLFALLAANGAGPLSLDRLLAAVLARRTAESTNEDPHIVIVGAGFGGIACAQALRHERVRVTLIDRRNYSLFQPLLYQVATASLSPADIATTIRAAFRGDARLTVLCGTASGIDPQLRTVKVDGRDYAYDHLILATGATHSYFGHERWATHAPGLKTVEDAIAVRARILTAFERAEATENVKERQRLLTFLICGGGPTGVELAGAIAELARHGLQNDFRHFDPASARVVLVQSGPRILPAFSESLSSFARESLERLGVEVRVGSRVEAIDEIGAVVNGVRVPAATVLWAAGVVASPAAKWLNQDGDAAGRVKVAANLSVPGWPNIYAIGDTAASFAWNGLAVPGLAPAAKQQGVYVASVLRAQLRGNSAPPPFVYKHQGSLATIGRQSAVADFGWLTLSGARAWWVWGAVHIFFLAGLRNRISVFVGWLWCYFTFRVGVQLITGDLAGDAAEQNARNLGSEGAK